MKKPFLATYLQDRSHNPSVDTHHEEVSADRIERCWLISCDPAIAKDTRITEVRRETTDDR